MQAQHLESQASIRQAQETIAAMQAQAAGQEENAKEQAAKLALLQVGLLRGCCCLSASSYCLSAVRSVPLLPKGTAKSVLLGMSLAAPARA